jgi:hypothetical protein
MPFSGPSSLSPASPLPNLAIAAYPEQNKLHVIAELYPALSFAGVFQREQKPDAICYYQCHKGELTGYEEVDEAADWENLRPVSQEYMGARLKNHIAEAKL